MSNNKQNIAKKLLEITLNSRIIDTSKVEQGEWSQTYIGKISSGLEYVIRFSDLREDFDKDKFAFEHFSSSRLLIPKVIKIGKIDNKFYAISEKANGKAIDFVNKKQMTQLLPAVFELLYDLKNTDISYTKGYGNWNGNGNGNASFSSWKQYLKNIALDQAGNRLQGWRKNLEKSSIGDSVFDFAFNKMCTLLNYCPERRYLIHADLLHFNLLVVKDKIASVLDWGCSKYGDYLYELAWFTYFLPWHDYMNHINIREKAKQYFQQKGLNIINFEKRLQCYEIHIGLDSLIYCAYKKDWKNARDIVERTKKVAELELSI